MATYSEHMAWCKQRALAELPNTTNAIASFASDIRKDPSTADNPTITMLVATVGLRHAMNNDVPALRKFIEDFAS